MIQVTQEQKEIIDCQVLPGETLKIIAFAGTGKTTTLVEYTRKRPELRFLYIAFNKSVQTEAAAKFPANVTARTTHALAFRAKGFKYKEHLVGGFKANQVMSSLGLDSYEDARFTMDTLHNYLVSPDPRVSVLHIPPMARAVYKKKGTPLPDLVTHANTLGRLMCDGSDPAIGMLHDGYLKLFQLSTPHLNYDCILLDEAQDINPVTAAIVFAQTQTQANGNQTPSALILVGDGHQQIYSFRGAKDSLKTFPAARTCYLTRSFRFDANIARAANMVLTAFKQETRQIVGTLRSQKPPWDPAGHTIIARTNATLFDKAVHLYKKHKIGFVGGVAGYRLNLIKDVYYLFQEEEGQITDPYIRSFKGFEELKFLARAVEDFELATVCKIVEKYRSRIPGHVDQILARAVDEKQAQILLTTAHKSKGLEWDNVLLLEDFHPLVKEDKIIAPAGKDPDEFNLIYVAITRARVNLRFHPESSIPAFIRLFQDKKGKSRAPVRRAGARKTP